MIYHLLDFGAYSGSVEEFSDLKGYVPTQEEDWHQFKWDHRMVEVFSNPETGDLTWHEFLEKSTIAAAKAMRSMEGLRDVKRIAGC